MIMTLTTWNLLGFRVTKKSPAKTMFDACAALVIKTAVSLLSCNSPFVVRKTVLDTTIHIGHLYYLRYCVPNRIAKLVDGCVHR